MRDIDGEIVGSVVVGRDITERKRADLERQRAADCLQVLADASHAFAEVGTEYQTLLDQIARTTAEVLGAGCVIRLLSDDRQWLDAVTVYNPNSTVLAITQRIFGHVRAHVDDPTPFVKMLHSGEQLFIPVIDPESARASMPPELWPIFQSVRPHSLLGALLRVHGQIIGSLVCTRFDPEQPPFDHDDLAMAQDLADRAALAISNARLLQQVQCELTERASADAVLRESEERLCTVTEAARIGLVIVDRQHTYRYANRSYADMFRLPTAEIVGQRVADVLAPVYNGQIRSRLERAFGGERVSYELVVPPAAPDWQEHSYVVNYEPGVYRLEPVVIVVVVEITERRQAEEQVRYQADLLNQVSDAIISVDLNYAIKSWNAGAETLYGWPAQEVIG